MNSKRFFLFVFCVIFLCSLNFAQVQIVENSASTIRILWNIDHIDTVMLNDGNSQSVVLSFKGQNTVIGTNGEVALPGYSFFAGIPPQGVVAVSVVAEKVTNMALPASPQIIVSKNTYTDQKQLEFSSPWASRPSYEKVKGIRIASFIIRPAIYEKESRTLKVMTRGIITIQLPTAVQHASKIYNSEFETMLSHLLCNYDIAKRWREESSSLKKRKSGDVFPLDNSKVYHFQIGDGFKEFNEVTTLENGLMRIPGSTVTGEFGTVPMSNVKLYGSVKGELSTTVPPVDSLPDGIIEIPLMRIDKNKNGMVDADDFFIAFVTGASDWTFNGDDYQFNIDRYDDYRNYWLTTGFAGHTIEKYTNLLSSDTVLNHFIQPYFLKKCEEIPTGSEGGLDWIWYKLNWKSRNFSQQLTFPGIDTTIPGVLNLNFHMYMGSLSLKVGELETSNASSGENYTITSWGNGLLQSEFTPDSNIAYCEIQNIRVNYSRKMEIPEKGMLTIFSTTNSGNYTYKIGGLDGELVYIMRVSTDDEIQLIDTIRSTVDGKFSWIDSGKAGTRYVVCREKNLLSLPAHNGYSNAANVTHSVHDLRNISNNTGYLIITHRDFIAQAESLAVHKEKMGYLHPAVVDVTDIYRLFSGGDVDPTAIRNFVLYVKMRQWVKGSDLDFVLLLGSGHYDIKQRKAAKKPVFLPTYYKSDEILEDDYFTITEPYTFYPIPSCAIGRINCETIQDAENVVNKIKEYEDPAKADFSAWRNRALFVADDDKQGDLDDPIISMTPHHVSSDFTSDELIRKWQSLDLRKVFLYEYEWDSSKRKPAASRAIINQINNGTGFVNYFGHGSSYIWADEEVLSLSDLGKLYNKKQYPLISSFSCSVGKFDLPGSECLSGQLLKLPNAGAIAAISSSRSSYAYSNEKLAINFYSQLTDTNGSPQSIGIMFVKAKIVLLNESNRTYVLLGDPSIKFVNSVRKVNLDIVDDNGQSLSEIKAMQLVKVKGSVLNSAGTVDNGYGSGKKTAYVQIGFFNPDDSVSRKDKGTREMRYVLPGSPIFLGKTKVTNGFFEQTILIPKKVAFNDSGIRLTAFSWTEGINDCGNGFRSDYIFNGSADALLNDTTGPAVSIQPYVDTNSTHFGTEKIMVMQLSLYDPSGVDIIGIDPDEGLTFEIPGVLAKRNINNSFQFKEGDFKSGTALIEIPVPSVKEKSNSLIVTSRDLLGNLSVTTFPVDFNESKINDGDLVPNLENVFNFPNPVRIGQTTRFFFYKSEINERFIPNYYRFVVKVYTLNGKLIKVFKDTHNGVVWDCRDQRGKLLSPDVYLYQVQAYSSFKKKLVKSKLGKVVIIPPQ
jgi:hypothetical protein